MYTIRHCGHSLILSVFSCPATINVPTQPISDGQFHGLLVEGWWKGLASLLLYPGVTILLYLLIWICILVDQVHWSEEAHNLDCVWIACSKDAAVGLGFLMFAFNPISVYAVAYRVQRSIVMATLFWQGFAPKPGVKPP